MTAGDIVSKPIFTVGVCMLTDALEVLVNDFIISNLKKYNV
jgi:hypothetical protein